MGTSDMGWVTVLEASLMVGAILASGLLLLNVKLITSTFLYYVNPKRYRGKRGKKRDKWETIHDPMKCEMCRINLAIVMNRMRDEDSLSRKTRYLTSCRRSVEGRKRTQSYR